MSSLIRKDICLCLYLQNYKVILRLCVCVKLENGGETTIFMAQREFACFRQEVNFRESFLMLGVEGRG